MENQDYLKDFLFNVVGPEHLNKKTSHEEEDEYGQIIRAEWAITSGQVSASLWRIPAGQSESKLVVTASFEMQ